MRQWKSYTCNIQIETRWWQRLVEFNNMYFVYKCIPRDAVTNMSADKCIQTWWHVRAFIEKQKKTNLIFSIIIIYSWRWRIDVAEKYTRRPANWDMFIIMFLVCIFDSMQMIIIALLLKSVQNLYDLYIYVHRCMDSSSGECQRFEEKNANAVKRVRWKVSDGNLPQLWSVRLLFFFLYSFFSLFHFPIVRCCPFHVRINGKHQIPIDRSNACNVWAISTSYNSIVDARIYQQEHIAMP